MRNERIELIEQGRSGYITIDSALDGRAYLFYEWDPDTLSNELRSRVQQAGILTNSTEIFCTTKAVDLTTVSHRDLLMRVDCNMVPGSPTANQLLEAIHSFIQCGVRWDNRDESVDGRRQGHDLSLLDITVKMHDYVHPQLRSSIIDTLLSAGPHYDEYEKQHLNEAALHAYEMGKMAVYHQLVRHGAVPMGVSESKAFAEGHA